MLNRALFADVSLRVPPSALFNFTRGEEVSRTLFPRLSDIRPLRPLQTNLDDESVFGQSNTFIIIKQPRYYELLRVKSPFPRGTISACGRALAIGEEGIYRFCLGLLDVWLPADNYSWNCFSRRARPCDNRYARARVNMYMNMGSRKRGMGLSCGHRCTRICIVSIRRQDGYSAVDL